MILVTDHNLLGDIIIFWTVHTMRQDTTKYAREEGLQRRPSTAMTEVGGLDTELCLDVW